MVIKDIRHLRDLSEGVMNTQATIQYKVDANHGGIRLVVLVILVGGSVLGFVAVSNLVETLTVGPGEICLTVPGGLALGVTMAWVAERVLRVVWPSGRWIEVFPDRVTLHERSGEPVSIYTDKWVNVLSWHFVIRQRRVSVPRGWCCVALRMLQDENLIAPYAFVKPSVAESIPQWHAFEELISRKHAPKRGREHELKLISEQGHLRTAEKDRWNNGAEMQPADFIALVAELDARLASWPESEVG